MPTESATNGSTRRDELLAVAAKLFAARGYHGTRMDDVADVIGADFPRSPKEVIRVRCTEAALGLKEGVGYGGSFHKKVSHRRR